MILKETTQTLSDSKEVPKTKLALEEKYKEEAKIEQSKRVDETNVDSIQDELPTPTGWRLLVLPFTPKDKTKGGIIVAQETLDRLRIAVNCGYVLKMGPEAYKDKDKFGYGIYQGVMSDEVIKKAVVIGADGYDRVNYSLLDVEFKKVKD